MFDFLKKIRNYLVANPIFPNRRRKKEQGTTLGKREPIRNLLNFRIDRFSTVLKIVGFGRFRMDTRTIPAPARSTNPKAFRSLFFSLSLSLSPFFMPERKPSLLPSDLEQSQWTLSGASALPIYFPRGYQSGILSLVHCLLPLYTRRGRRVGRYSSE